MTAAPVKHRDFFIREGSSQHQLFECKHKFILLEGPANTGKTAGALYYSHMMCEQKPGLRVAFCRERRKDLSTTVLPIFEKWVLPSDHESKQGATPEHRSAYRYKNGSQIDLHGMDEMYKIYSAEYDIIVVFEAVEVSSVSFNALKRAMRGGTLPDRDKRIIADTNPAEETHWLNVAAKNGELHRIKAKFIDNPKCSQDFIDGLDTIVPIWLRERLRDGKWNSAEGMLWDTYDAGIHLIDGSLKRGSFGWQLEVPAWGTTIDLRWFFGGVDWGYKDPGCLQVWGVDDEHRAFRVKEIYRRFEERDWWAERASIYRDRYGVMHFACDPSDEGSIALFNQRMSRHTNSGYAGSEKVAGKAINVRAIGHDVVRECFSKRVAFLVRGANEWVDNALRESHAPWKTEDEIPAYHRAPTKDGQATKDDSPPNAIDHGCDTTRYSMMWFNSVRPKKFDMRPQEDPFPPGSLGRLLGHVNVGKKQEAYDEYDHDGYYRRKARHPVVR